MNAVQEAVLEQLAGLHDQGCRREFFSQNPHLLSTSTSEMLDAAVAEFVRKDLKKAQYLAAAALALAGQLGNRGSQAYALRAQANALWFAGQNQQAADLHAQAVQLFEAEGKPVEAARTLSASIQPLILLGEYDRALAAAERAREIFSAAGETLRLARLEINIGNIFHRQDRFREALASYERAYQQLLPDKDVEGLVASLHNIAVCLITLNEYQRALTAYEQVRTICQERNMPLAVAQADYNIAYLYYFRGEYGRAIEMLRTTRETCQRVGDPYHAALCHLDLSEIYLELNMSEDAAEMADEAFRRFQELGTGYEAAKALCNSAIALSEQGNGSRALELFAQARTKLVKEKNLVWPSLIDLYQALIYFREERLAEARQNALRALEFFRTSPLPGRAILCRLLLARLSLKTGEIEAARQECRAALCEFSGRESPILVYQAHFVMGEIEEAAQHQPEARSQYLAAKEVVETLRSRLHAEDLKISFMRNRFEVYENLVNLCLAQDSDSEVTDAAKCSSATRSEHLRDPTAPERRSMAEQVSSELVVLPDRRAALGGSPLGEGGPTHSLHSPDRRAALCSTQSLHEEAWTYMEQAKSRSLLDLISHPAIPEASGGPGESELLRRVRDLREQLNWYYHRLEREQLGQAPPADQRLLELRELAGECEKELLRVLRELPSGETEPVGLEAAAPVSLEALRRTLGSQVTLVEYFQVRERILAAIVTAHNLQIVPVTLAPRIARILRLLQFQFSRMRLGLVYVRRFETQLLEAARGHLHELYAELVAPIRPQLQGPHLVVVPHGLLHYVPFHALFDGEQYLIDQLTVSYAPSGSVYVQCQQKPVHAGGASLILGIPDAQTPSIQQELQSAATILPDAELFLGTDASLRVLREKGKQSRVIHIATHGFFRPDNPMFSGIRLGDTFLTLYDLSSLSLPAEQITLSGCSTGLSMVAAGDELIGMVRGLLSAGAHSLLLTLWDVNDASTAQFMKGFYRRLLHLPDRALALREAMQELRERYAHPYFWAPFILVGKVFAH